MSDRLSAPASAPQAFPLRPGAAQSAGSLLVVDDQSEMLATLCVSLQAEGYAVTGAATSAAALEALAATEYDLLLTDLSLREMNGIQLFQTAISEQPSLVAVVMTGHGTIESAIEALQLGALDYILKPFTSSTLLPVIDRALTIRRLRLANAALERRVSAHVVELEAANAALECFSYSVSHDLRAPLRALTSYAEAVVEDHAADLPAAAGELLGRIVASSQRMEGVISSLLALATASRQPLARSPVRLSIIVQSVIGDLQVEYPNWKGTVLVGALPDCEGDPELLEQLLVNLLSNAFKFTRDRARPVIEVGYAQSPLEEAYFVRDNGVGFDQVLAERAFVAFQRLHSAAQFSGHGIGLSIVQRIVIRHGGRVWAKSQPDQGACFYFTLPGVSR